MVTSTTLRAASARGSRAGSTARDILKRREKPYKTEQEKVFVQKRKLNLEPTHARPRPGYVFLPVGTPDLAEKCKEMSRQSGFPVSVVNSRPTSRLAEDPTRISHHVHRVGYHFRAEVVEEACEQLEYTVYKGQYIKLSDMPTRSEGLQSTLLKFGIDPASVEKSDGLESPEKVGAAIKELFPKIPEQDLKDIVHHAWKKGTKRVGNNSNLDLPRRVQLATAARIRHMYTDYDLLLRAFEWKDARSMVEGECLRKLIEWRGEAPDDAEDQELEWIVRETIVLDDDDDQADAASEADDEGDSSDDSVQITEVRECDDIGAESGVDDRTRRLLDRNRQRDEGHRATIAKQKIGAMRQHMRQPQAVPTPQRAGAFPMGQPEQPQQEVVFGGQRFRMLPPQASVHHQPTTPTNGSYTQRQIPAAHSGHSYLSPSGQIGHPTHDHPLASIEVGSHATRPANGADQYPRAYPGPSCSLRDGGFPTGREVIDLTSPGRHGRGTRSSPYAVPEYAPAVAPAPRTIAHGATVHDMPFPGYVPRQEVRESPIEPYDPTRPFGQGQRPYTQVRPVLDAYHEKPSTAQPVFGQPAYNFQYVQPQQPVHGAPAPVQQAPREVPAQALLPYVQQYAHPPRADGNIAPTQYYYAGPGRE